MPLVSVRPNNAYKGDTFEGLLAKVDVVAVDLDGTLPVSYTHLRLPCPRWSRGVRMRVRARRAKGQAHYTRMQVNWV